MDPKLTTHAAAVARCATLAYPWRVAAGAKPTFSRGNGGLLRTTQCGPVILLPSHESDMSGGMRVGRRWWAAGMLVLATCSFSASVGREQDARHQ